MTISSTSSKAGPYLCNGATTVYSFNFKVFNANDLKVVRTAPDGNETILLKDTQYFVTLNSNQSTNPGGTITTGALGGGSLVYFPTGNKITILSNINPTQAVQVTNFRPTVIENALDKLTMLVQQLAEQVSRSFKAKVGATESSDEFVANMLSTIDSANANAAATLAQALNAVNQYAPGVLPFTTPMADVTAGTVGSIAYEVDIWSPGKGIFQKWAGAGKQISSFALAPSVGAYRVVDCTGVFSLNNTANIKIQGADGGAYSSQVGDRLLIEADTLTTVKIWVYRMAGNSSGGVSPSTITTLTNGMVTAGAYDIPMGIVNNKLSVPSLVNVTTIRLPATAPAHGAFVTIENLTGTPLRLEYGGGAAPQIANSRLSENAIGSYHVVTYRFLNGQWHLENDVALRADVPPGTLVDIYDPGGPREFPGYLRLFTDNRSVQATLYPDLYRIVSGNYYNITIPNTNFSLPAYTPVGNVYRHIKT